MKIVSFIVVLITLLVAPIAGAYSYRYADNSVDPGLEPRINFANSKEEQETVCEALNGRVPISVTPVYYYILYDSDTGNGYKNGDEIVLSKTPRPGTFIYSVTLKDYAAPVDGTVYIYSRAMTVVESKNGQMTAGIISCTRSAEDNPNYLADSTNYADFAEDIRILSGRDEIIDPKYVRLVAIPNVGECFYIKDSTDEFFYYLSGYLGEFDITHGARIMRVGEDLERAAGEVKEYLARQKNDPKGEAGGSSSLDVEPAVVEFQICFRISVRCISSFLRVLRSMLSDVRIPDRLPELRFRLQCGRSFCIPRL